MAAAVPPPPAPALAHICRRNFGELLVTRSELQAALPVLQLLQGHAGQEFAERVLAGLWVRVKPAGQYRLRCIAHALLDPPGGGPPLLALEGVGQPVDLAKASGVDTLNDDALYDAHGRGELACLRQELEGAGQPAGVGLAGAAGAAWRRKVVAGWAADLQGLLAAHGAQKLILDLQSEHMLAEQAASMEALLPAPPAVQHAQPEPWQLLAAQQAPPAAAPPAAAAALPPAAQAATEPWPAAAAQQPLPAEPGGANAPPPHQPEGPASPRAPRQQHWSLYVTGLPVDAKSPLVANFFRRHFPSVLRCNLLELPSHGPGRPSPRERRGFVRFGSREERDAALAQMQGHEFGGRAIKLELPRDEQERAAAQPLPLEQEQRPQPPPQQQQQRLQPPPQQHQQHQHQQQQQQPKRSRQQQREAQQEHQPPATQLLPAVQQVQQRPPWLPPSVQLELPPLPLPSPPPQPPQQSPPWLPRSMQEQSKQPPQPVQQATAPAPCSSTPAPALKPDDALGSPRAGRQQHGPAAPPGWSLFVKDLPPDASEGAVAGFFRSFFPSVRWANLLDLPAATTALAGPPRSRQGFVRFGTLRERDAALVQMQGQRFHGHAISVNLPRDEQPPVQPQAPTTAPQLQPQPHAQPPQASGTAPPPQPLQHQQAQQPAAPPPSQLPQEEQQQQPLLVPAEPAANTSAELEEAMQLVQELQQRQQAATEQQQQQQARSGQVQQPPLQPGDVSAALGAAAAAPESHASQQATDSGTAAPSPSAPPSAAAGGEAGPGPAPAESPAAPAAAAPAAADSASGAAAAAAGASSGAAKAPLLAGDSELGSGSGALGLPFGGSREQARSFFSSVLRTELMPRGPPAALREAFDREAPLSRAAFERMQDEYLARFHMSPLRRPQRAASPEPAAAKAPLSPRPPQQQQPQPPLPPPPPLQQPQRQEAEQPPSGGTAGVLRQLQRQLQPQGHALRVSNIAGALIEVELYEYFKERYPSVLSAAISSEGIGTVRFASDEERRRASLEMYGHVLPGGRMMGVQQIADEPSAAAAAGAAAPADATVAPDAPPSAAAAAPAPQAVQLAWPAAALQQSPFAWVLVPTPGVQPLPGQVPLQQLDSGASSTQRYHSLLVAPTEPLGQACLLPGSSGQQLAAPHAAEAAVAAASNSPRVGSGGGGQAGSAAGLLPGSAARQDSHGGSSCTEDVGQEAGADAGPANHKRGRSRSPGLVHSRRSRSPPAKHSSRGRSSPAPRASHGSGHGKSRSSRSPERSTRQWQRRCSRSPERSSKQQQRHSRSPEDGRQGTQRRGRSPERPSWQQQRSRSPMQKRQHKEPSPAGRQRSRSRSPGRAAQRRSSSPPRRRSPRRPPAATPPPWAQQLFLRACRARARAVGLPLSARDIEVEMDLLSGRSGCLEGAGVAIRELCLFMQARGAVQAHETPYGSMLIRHLS